MKFFSTLKFLCNALHCLRLAKEAPVLIGSRYGREEFLIVSKEHYDALFLEALGGSLSACAGADTSREGPAHENC